MDLQQEFEPGSRRRPARELPPYYYHAHFCEMLDFVARHYGHALDADHRAFLHDFRELPANAQYLYVRLVNRKGRVFDGGRLRYPEIGRLERPLRQLRDHGWIGAPGSEHFAELVPYLNRRELLRILLSAFAGISRSLRKSDYVAFALDHLAPQNLLDQLPPRLFVQRRTSVVRYLLFLYFGRLPDGLSRFTMRDLGLVEIQGFTERFEPRFNEREEAAQHFYYACRLDELANGSGAAIRRLLGSVASWPEPTYPGSARLRDDLALKLGRAAEREDPEKALAVYAQGESPECAERRVRLLLSQQRKDDAQALLEACLEMPDDDNDWLFARDLYARVFDSKRVGAATNRLRAGEIIELDESYAGAPERGAVAWYRGRGQQAWHVENTLWRTLFGLLFWKELFESDHAGLHSPFDWRAKSLSDGEFYRAHRDAIERKLADLRDPAATLQALLKTSTRHYGRANGVFRWRRQTLDALFAMLPQLPTVRLAAPLRRLSQRFDDVCHGYPDLLVMDRDGARFVEIKAEGDQLRRNQLARLEQLRAAGLRADVVRVRWSVDAAQEYVVVDVETTGGRGLNHRITELGAVRVHDGRIRERFETLLDPQRGIPANIARLTGISQEMVANAPVFSEVADQFEEFLGDRIFVAHNVAFDYRFVRAEFGRLGRRFERARLCTCSSMRKWYPGLRSYSLAALCDTFGIPLRQHHRALCDAEAAAELLILVNERRQEQLAG